MKSIFTIIVLVVLLIAIPVAVFYNKQQQDIRSKAAPATILSFSPSSITRKTNDTFSLNVSIDTGSNTISAAKLVVNADGTKVKITGITADTFLSNVIVSPSYTDSKATITLGSPATSPKQGTGTLATVTFQIIGTAGTSQISFTGSKVAGISEESNVLSQSSSANVTIEQGVSSTSTPTPTTIHTGTPTPTTGSGGNPTSTSTPTPTTAYENTPTPTEQTVDSGGENEIGGAEIPVTGAFEPLVLLPILSAIGVILIGFVF